MLTAAAVLLGVLMAVFGQVYQTGANAYDLFLSWTIAITLWVVIANFALLYTAGMVYGFRQKSLFYLAIIPFSIIMILSALSLKISDDAGMFLFIALFIIGSVSFLKKKLIDQQKQWNHETGA
ncbi:hypothetical protein [Paraflavitalea speifideaquila]|uniref:hypothetical protein n=1 Tax=Paraflavitalea speifideaquila TaxID=3076558 RepID=UPI0028F0EE3E|nr:hypothetical protein [Paraflavitalea speifideiaquila]